MKVKKPTISDVLFGLFVLLLLIPQTRTPIQVAVNRLKMIVLSPSAIDTSEQTQIQPFNYQLSDMNGDYKSIPIGKGSVTFISYWATWCPPCIAELPSIQKLFTDYDNQMNFILLTNEDPAIVQRFVNKKGYALPIYFPKMETPNALSERSIPTSYIINNKGKVVVKETGAADWDSPKIRALLDDLITK